MIIKRSVFPLVAVMAFAFMGGNAYGQQPMLCENGQPWEQSCACPGWNNPSSFMQGDANNYYSGQGINISSSGKPCPNPNPPSYATGVNSMGSNYTKSQLQQGVSSSGSYCSSSLDEPFKQFRIMTSTTGTDPNTGNSLRYVPTWYNTTGEGQFNTTLTRSIRIGDGCSNGSGSDGHSGAALYYTMRVTPQNAMLYLYYAIVAEAPGHGQRGNPTLVIRVMKKNSANQWTQINTNLGYYISSTPSSDHSDDCPNMGYVTLAAAGQNGWHQYGTGYNAVYYKDWDKVSINLSEFLNETLQVQVLMYDCIYNAHYAYAYICGECRPMEIQSSGCPAGLSTDVTTLTAPRDLQNYVWYASEWGVSDPTALVNPGGDNEHFTWRQLTPNQSTSYTYNVQASDFQVTKRRNEYGVTEDCDSIGNRQTFRCKMTSALDPAKPFDSYLYVNVQNKKPTMLVDSMLACDGSATLWNKSFVPGDPTLIKLSETSWKFYNNPYCEGEVVASMVGDSALTYFTDTEMKGVRVRSFTTDTCCYSDAIYSLQPRENPQTILRISDTVLCDADLTTLTDATEGEHLSREWSFRPADAPDDDMTLSDKVTGEGDENRVLTRSFTHFVEPIELRVFNGTYQLDPSNLADTVWCQTMVSDTVQVFLHPELEVLGDTVVCEGNLTDATVRAVDMDGCTYQWSTTLGRITGNLPEGPNLQVTPYADKSTYYVKVTSPAPAFCEAWDSIHAYVVRPKLTVLPTDGRICPGDVATLTGSNAHHYSWTASPDDPSLAGQDSMSQIRVSPTETTTYTLVGHGSNNCNATPLQQTVTVMPLPVPNVRLTPEFVDTDDPTMVLRDQSTYGVSSSWFFNDGQMATGREVSHVFGNCIGLDSVPVTLTSYNELECPTVYPFKIPVSVFTAWFPTAFTPGSNDENDKFSLYTINEYELFHIYIYNRRGELIYESDDVHFQWDGTKDGEPCPQGAYVYTCRFRKPGTPTLRSIQGTVTIIR